MKELKQIGDCDAYSAAEPAAELELDISVIEIKYRGNNSTLMEVFFVLYDFCCVLIVEILCLSVYGYSGSDNARQRNVSVGLSPSGADRHAPTPATCVAKLATCICATRTTPRIIPIIILMLCWCALIIDNSSNVV